MPTLGLIRAFLEQASAQGSRSTVLRPIGWMMPICVTATLAAVYIKAPFWVTAMFGAFSGLTMLLYLGAYLLCLITDKDALRSETYSIQKLAIEKGFVGDSLTGVIPVDTADHHRLVDVTTTSTPEEKQ